MRALPIVPGLVVLCGPMWSPLESTASEATQPIDAVDRADKQFTREAELLRPTGQFNSGGHRAPNTDCYLRQDDGPEAG